jgi:FKBP-type peptidyl-prolyl cis-trans isomerase SlyD
MEKRVFTFNYVLRGDGGAILDQSSGDPLAFLEGAGQIIPALEAKLILLSPGDKATIKLAAVEAYGETDKNLVVEVPRSELSHIEITEGAVLQMQMGEQTSIVQVRNVTAETVTLDGNHPLSGQNLEFDIEIVAVRNATSEELHHGHAHGPGGHAH